MCQACREVRLVGVEGDQEEYADLIGTEGVLRLDPHSTDSGINWYNPNGSGETLALSRKRVTEKDGKVRVHTKLGNTFIFRLKETK
jgi:hypothetical protein